MAAIDTHIPVNLITGFLGSGKTTLLQRLLADPALADTAVLINEFGEVGLDHLLLQHVDEETVILQSGCICCTIRDDLSRAIRELHAKRDAGQVPHFTRLVIETTGLAEPAPIASTLAADPVIRHHFRLSNIVTTVDAVNGALHLAQNPESVQQVAAADRLVLTKTDIAEPSAVEDLRAKLTSLNPTAAVIEAAGADIDPDQILVRDIQDRKGKRAEIKRWLAAMPHDHDSRTPDDGNVNRHDRGIRAVCLTFEDAIDWTAFGIWLTMLLHAHGERVLRVKGILNVPGSKTPVAIHGVQHVVHPPVHLDRWPDTDRRSRIVFIVRDLDPATIEASLAAFNRLAGAQTWAA